MIFIQFTLLQNVLLYYNIITYRNGTNNYKYIIFKIQYRDNKNK